MAQLTGAVILNGLSDTQLVTVMEIKAANPQMVFNPQQMQPINETINGKVQQAYNNVQISFSKPEGIKAVQEILTKLTP